LLNAGPADIPPITEAKMSAIRILPTIEVLIDPFLSWNDLHR
jgi:hypothetical protein